MCYIFKFIMLFFLLFFISYIIFNVYQRTGGIFQSEDDKKYDQHTLREREKADLNDYSMSFLELKFNDTQTGGRWRPRQYSPAKRVAIIVPFRDRDQHLRQLLNNLIPKLRRQKVDYTFYVVEQAPGSRFNRGLVKNIGFVEARAQAKYDCYIFNDVDNIIESDYNFYTCKPGVIMQMATRLQRYEYQLMYPSYVGGIVSFTAELFQRANGFTNFLFAWGGEDDGLWRRVRNVGGMFERTSFHKGCVSTLHHSQEENEIHNQDKRFLLYHQMEPFSSRDGLNTLNYSCTITRKKLFTHVYAEVDEIHYQKMFKEYKRERNAAHQSFAQLRHKRQCVRKNFSQFLSSQLVCTVQDNTADSIQPLLGLNSSHRQVAIIIPFKCHPTQLRNVVDTIKPVLRTQNIAPSFYVIQQEDGASFNQGLLNNIGFLEAFKQEQEQHENYECFAFLNLRSMFHDNCTSNLYRQSLLYELKRPFACGRYSRYIFNTYKCSLAGFHRMIFTSLNGYSNFYFNSGVEHEDLYRRIKSTPLKCFNTGDIFRPYKNRFNNESWAVYNRILPYIHKDGLTSVRYTLVTKRQQRSMTWITVRTDESYYHKLFKRYISGR